ncbi:hypothetical protein [Pectobacterium polaris]|uniref:Uncharacterized protein n=1 Tax=Pectobacterium polaris TaxID=2042057 RepID=A0AAW5GAZ4_9GAMM|nr:hypothetical protein [Pectobacterium polaris]MCL6350632.1 hypothetical protein [Pectobacterium polaris]MCL6368030.1 hypothetical protein [Pectobacterium polaris]
MADYKSILTIAVKHEYYNSHKDELAPFDIVPVQETEFLFKQYSILMKSKLGFIQLIVDSELFSDLANLTQEFNLKFYLVSTDPVVRSITKMPNSFDISDINAEIIHSATLNITADNWIERNKLNEDEKHNGIAIYNNNLISILNVNISKSFLNLEKKFITVQFNAISTLWKYYFFLLNSKKNLHISNSSDGIISFTQQEHEQIFGKTAIIFTSNNELPLRKEYKEFFSLLNDKKIIIKSLPFPDPNNISTLLFDGRQHLISHIYVS